MSMPIHTGPKTCTKCWQARNKRRNTLGHGSGNVDTCFSPFVVSTVDLLGNKAKILAAGLKKLSFQLTKRWQKPSYKLCGFMNALMRIAILKATHFYLCISFGPLFGRIPLNRRNSRDRQANNESSC